MNQFRNLIEGKSVAVVGRGAYLKDIERGELIDSHDVVARIHHPLPHPTHQYENFQLDPESSSFIPETWHSRIGSNTHLFAADFVARNQVFLRDIFAHLLRTGCKMGIVHKCYNVHTGDCIPKVDLIQDAFMPVHFAAMENFINLYRQMNYAFPLPGTLLIHEILQYNPKSLYHTGFSCFQDHTKLSAHAEVTLTRQHHTLLDLRYLRQITTHNDHITTDEFMLKLFEREENLE